MVISDVLSKDEVATLLSQAEASDADSVLINTDNETVENYDITKEHGKSLDQGFGFRTVNTVFKKQCSDALFELLHRKIEVQNTDSHVSRYNNFLKNESSTSTTSIIRIQPSQHFGFIKLSRELIFNLIEILFGGNVELSKELDRPFAKIDMRIAQFIAEKFCAAYSQAWASVSPMVFDHFQTIADPMLSNSISHEEEMMIFNFDITFEETTSTFQLGIPQSVLMPISELLENDSQSEASKQEQLRWKHALKENIYDSDFKVAGVLTNTTIKLKELLQLKVGDVMAITIPEYGYLTLEGVKLSKGKCGVNKGEHVIELIDAIK